MNKKEAQKLYNSITNVKYEYIEEAQTVKIRRKSPILLKWRTLAASLCLICVSAIVIVNVNINTPMFRNKCSISIKESLIPDFGVVDISNTEQAAKEQDNFVPITALLADGGNGIVELAAMYSKISIGEYTGIYEKVPAVSNNVLSESVGANVLNTTQWYYVSGHMDMQYLIRNDNQEYSLWKFLCFDHEEYPYQDVLELIYQINSSDKISEIEVRPATMDNTDEGKKIQEKIGTHKITEREKIDAIYQILSSLTCYGSNHWDMIDYGFSDAPADNRPSSHQSVLLGRYLSIVTDYGNEIDGLKYTAVSNMFYEYTGIAYNRLTTEQAESLREILGIKEDEEEYSQNNTEENTSLSEGQYTEYNGNVLSEAQNTGVSLEYVTELQSKVSTAMINGELPFVTSSAVYENPYRLHIVVTSNEEGDLQKLQELDYMGGTLEIEYTSTNNNRLENLQKTAP